MQEQKHGKLCARMFWQDIDLEALFESESAPGDASNAAPKYSLTVLDALPALGPIRSLVTSPPPPRLAGEEPSKQNLSAQVC